MNWKLGIRRTVISAAFLTAFVVGGQAFAIYEIEPNDSMTPSGRRDCVATAQRLEIGSGGSVEVTAVLGTLTGLMAGDVDCYVFEGRQGDVVMIDIDGGIKSDCSRARCVDTVVAIFGGGTWAQIDDPVPPYPRLDDGTLDGRDARIDIFSLPQTGAYLVGVSSWPRFFSADGTAPASPLNITSNGTYTLRISGVTPLVMQINIDIKPGDNDAAAPINPKSKGNIPVALLSNSNFNALEVDQQSLRFGPQGDEDSRLRCAKGGTDVNADGKLDLVCHFDTQAAGFEASDAAGIVTGRLQDGRRFEGRGYLKVVPVKRGQ